MSIAFPDPGHTIADMKDTPHERLKFARLSANYQTAAEFSSKHKIPQGTYANHETGGRGLRLPTAEHYAELLGNCDAAWLLTGRGRAPSKTTREDVKIRAPYWPAETSVEILGPVESSGAVPLADGSMALGFQLPGGRVIAFPMDRQSVDNIRKNLYLIEAHLNRAGS